MIANKKDTDACREEIIQKYKNHEITSAQAIAALKAIDMAGKGKDGRKHK